MIAATAPHPDDVLVALLALDKGEHSRFSGLSRQIHTTVHRLKGDFPEAFECFNFSTVTVYPYSDELATALGDLKWSRLLGMENPDFRVYFVKDDIERVFDEAVRPNLASALLAQLTQASRKFWGELEQG